MKATDPDRCDGRGIAMWTEDMTRELLRDIRFLDANMDMEVN